MMIASLSTRPFEAKKVVYLIVFLFGLNFWSTAVLDPDLSWHLLGGAWISSHNLPLNPFRLNEIVPKKDFVNSFNGQWHDYHWLSQVILYGVYSVGSYEFLAIFLGLLMAYLGKVLVDIVYRATPTNDAPLVACSLSLIALFLIRSVTTVRPQALAILLIALAVRSLENRNGKFQIAYLFALCVLGVNVHVYWIFIPLLWFIYRCLPRALRQRNFSAFYAWGGFFILGAAALVSPYGICSNSWELSTLLSNYSLLLEYLNTPAALSSIAEFKPLLSTVGLVALFFLFYFALVVRTFDSRKFLAASREGSALIISALLALYATKFVAVFAVLSLPYLARVATHWIRRWELHSVKNNVTASILASLLVGALVRAIFVFPLPGSKYAAIESVYPGEACRKIATVSGAPSGERDHVRVLTHFNYGGACRWSMYQAAPQKDIRVTTDGRTQGVPNEHFVKSSDLYSLQEGWDKTLAEWDPDFILSSREYALSYLLFRAGKEWEVIYAGNQFAVFRKIRNSYSPYQKS